MFTEVLRDVAHLLLPVRAPDVLDMLGEVKGAALLAGARGGTPADLDARVEALDALLVRADHDSTD